MVEAIVLWNEPNNLSHWNFHLDDGWTRFSEMVKMSAMAIRKVNPDLTIVLGGVSSCDCDFSKIDGFSWRNGVCRCCWCPWVSAGLESLGAFGMA